MRYAILISLILVGCNKAPVGIAVSNNPNFNVEKLFEVDGCTVYRFYEGMTAKYFTNCNGQVMWRESCGKNCSREESI